jgi:hypothetical protein
MKRIPLLVSLWLVLITSASVAQLASAGMSGKFVVRRIEFAHDIGSRAARVRVTLTNGLSVDLTLTDTFDSDRVLSMMHAASGGGRLFAVLQDGEVKTIGVDTGEGAGH